MTEAAEPAKGRWAEKLAVRRAAYRRRGRVYRALFLIGGVLVTLAGVALLVLPGPAFVIIPIGLAMLAMEFSWAERLLGKALEHAERAQHHAKEASLLSKVLTGLAVVLVVAAVVGGIFYWDIEVPLINPS